MIWQQLLIDTLDRVLNGLTVALADLSQEDLNRQPHPDSNSIGWLAWHLTRIEDRIISQIMGEEHIWIKGKWYAKFNRTADPADSGSGHTSEDVAAFKSPDVDVILGYHRAVLDRSKGYLDKLTESELGRELDHPKYKTVEALLVVMLSDSLQHLGQIAYLRGLLKGKGWL